MLLFRSKSLEVTALEGILLITLAAQHDRCHSRPADSPTYCRRTSNPSISPIGRVCLLRDRTYPTSKTVGRVCRFGEHCNMSIPANEELVVQSSLLSCGGMSNIAVCYTTSSSDMPLLSPVNDYSSGSIVYAQGVDRVCVDPYTAVIQYF